VEARVLHDLAGLGRELSAAQVRLMAVGDMGTRCARFLGLFGSVVAVNLLVLGVAVPASAHSKLERTDPADAAVLGTPVRMVTLTFNEMVRQRFTTVVVTGRGGVSFSDGHAQVVDRDVRQAVYPLRSGAYSVAWRTISADGHPVEGQFQFRVALPAGQEPTAGPPAAAEASRTAQGGGTPWWLWAAAGAALVVGVLLVRVLGRRRRTVTT
jgi:methionine-rich copper-binding protein CopC